MCKDYLVGIQLYIGQNYDVTSGYGVLINLELAEKIRGELEKHFIIGAFKYIEGLHLIISCLMKGNEVPAGMMGEDEISQSLVKKMRQILNDSELVVHAINPIIFEGKHDAAFIYRKNLVNKDIILHNLKSKVYEYKLIDATR